jgi:hypothetical protein
MANSDNKAFDMMTAAADKTAVDFSFMQEMQEKREIESILDAEFEKRDYGEQSAWFPTGKFLGKKVPRGVSGIVDALVLLAAGNVQNALKSTAKEEMVTLYRGVDKWFPGQMVKKGKFVGGGKALEQPWHTWIPSKLKKTTSWVTNDFRYAKHFAEKEVRAALNAAHPLFKNPPKSGPVLEFEVPLSYIKKHGLQSPSPTRVTTIFEEGIPKEFLKKVYK